jgi:hypothetical protein
LGGWAVASAGCWRWVGGVRGCGKARNAATRMHRVNAVRNAAPVQAVKNVACSIPPFQPPPGVG